MSWNSESQGDWELEDGEPLGVKTRVLEVAAFLWAVGIMGYYYYSEGHVERVAQIWSLIVG